MNAATNTQIVLASPSQGQPKLSDFAVNHATLPSCGDGQILVQVLYLSLDPYMRGNISGRHMSGSVPVGGVLMGESVARVLESKHPKFKAGDIVTAFTGWQKFAAVDGNGKVHKVDPAAAKLSLYVGILGMPGLTAYAGLLHLGEPKPGDTLVVSAATGPVGSMVGQIGKIRGCRVIGVAGSQAKGEWLMKEVGFDGFVNYKEGDFRTNLKAACPKGVDVYFDNVGGDMLTAVMENLARGARVVLCGGMAFYNEETVPPGPPITLTIRARATVRGMVVYDHEWRRDTFIADVTRWLKEGKIKYKEDMVQGIENAPGLFVKLMAGQNFGKTVVHVSD